MPVNFTQDLKFRTQPEERLDEFNFTGGLITDAHETKLEPNQSPNLANITFNNTGSIKTRNGFTRYNNDPVGAASDVSETGASTGSLAIDTYTDYVAQTFQPSGTVDVTQIDVYLAMQTSGEEQYVRVELWSTATGVPDELLTNGQSQIKLISGTSEARYSFRFREPVALTTGTTYVIVVKPYTTNSSNTVNQVNVYHRGATYANGQVYTSTDAAINWTADANKDLRFNVYSAGDTACTGLIRYYNEDGDQQFFAKFGNTLYRGNDGTGEMTAITLPDSGTFASANYLDYTVANNTLLVADGTNNIRKYRGSTNANYSTGTITVTQDSATVTGSGTSWNTSTNAEVGEYIKLPDGKWYRITAIGSDTSLTIECAYRAGTQSGQSYVISPWGTIEGELSTATGVGSLISPNPDFIANHLNRIWTLEGNTLRFSALDTSITEDHFNDWDTSNNAGTIIIPATGGDSGTGIYSLNGYLYVFQRNATWEIFGTSPSNFELRNISNEIGCINRRTLVEYDRYLMFLSSRGVYLFDGANMVSVSENSVDNLIATWANKTNCAATLWDNRYLIAYTPSGETYNSEAICYEIKNEIWSKHTNVFASIFETWDGGTDDGRIYFGSSNQGSIYRWDTGTNDDGYPIELVYDTPSLGANANTNDKALKKFYLQQLAKGDYNLAVIMFSDISTETSSSINLSNGSSSLWDIMEWDVDSWSAEGDIITTRIAEFQGSAKYRKFRFSQSTMDSPVEILGITMTQRIRRLS